MKRGNEAAIDQAEWDRVKTRLKQEFGDSAYKSWVTPIVATALRDGEVELSVPTRFMRDWITTHYADRIRALDQLDERIPPRPDFSLARHLDEQRKRGESLPARVWFAAEVQARARGESYATLVEDGVRDGGAEFTLFTYSHEWLARWILSFGAKAEAVEPPELRELVRAEAAAVAALHQETAAALR